MHVEIIVSVSFQAKQFFRRGWGVECWRLNSRCVAKTLGKMILFTSLVTQMWLICSALLFGVSFPLCIKNILPSQHNILISITHLTKSNQVILCILCLFTSRSAQLQTSTILRAVLVNWLSAPLYALQFVCINATSSIKCSLVWYLWPRIFCSANI